MSKKPYPYQLAGVRQLHRFKGRAWLGDEMGLGKAGSVTCRVLTPTGYRRMGDLRVGDLVIGSDGNPTRVTGVFPQGRKKVYRVTFSDRSQTECCDEHLWQVNTATRNWRGSPPRVLPLGRIKNDLTYPNGNRKHYIPMVSAPVRFNSRPESPTRIDSYLMGYLLANGGLTQFVGVTVPDGETISRLQAALPSEHALVKQEHGGPLDYVVRSMTDDGPNEVKEELTRCGLMGKKSPQKFVPKEYLLAPPADRLKLLQGLMDGDGYAAENGTVQFTSTSKRLAQAVRFLVETSGGSARQTHHRTQYTYKGRTLRGLDAYTLTIAMPRGINPFLLSRKAVRASKRLKYAPTRAFKSVRYIGRKECVCIAVDAPDRLYLTDQCIVTHNTAQALWYAVNHLQKWPMVVVCPASLKWNWMREAMDKANLRATVLEGTRPKWDALEDIDPDDRPVLVVNYDVLGGWVPLLKKLRPGLVVFDEAHYLKSLTAKRTRFARELADGVRKVVMVSGTPMTNRPAELWPGLNIIRPDLFPAFKPFGLRYCKPRWTPWGWKFDGAERLDELHKVLRNTCLIRRLKADVLDQLPAKVRSVVPVALDAKGQAEYRRAELDFIRWLKETNPKAANKARKAERVVRFGYLKRLAARLKMPAVEAWIDSFLLETDRKLIAFGVHRFVVQGLNELPKYRGISTRIDGRIKGVHRQHAVDLFTRDPNCRIIFGNLVAAGVGWNGQVAQDVLFAEIDWVPGLHRQAEDRAHRIGQTGRVQCHYLVASGTVEERLLEVIQRKQRWADAALDGGQVTDTLDVYDQLEKLMTSNAKGFSNA